MITAQAKLVSDRDGVRLHFSHDLTRLWNWFLLKETGMIMHCPKRGAKIGLYTHGKYHKQRPNYRILQHLIGKRFQIQLDPTQIKYLYSKKGYWVCWLNVEDENILNLIDELELSDNFNSHNRPHMSICNGKYFRDKNNARSNNDRRR